MYGRKVKIKVIYIMRLAKTNPELAKRLYGKTGVVVSKYCDYLWYWRVKFEDIELNLRYSAMEFTDGGEAVGYL